MDLTNKWKLVFDTTDLHVLGPRFILFSIAIKHGKV